MKPIIIFTLTGNLYMNVIFNRQLATLEDFDDDAMDIEGGVHGVANGNAHLPRPSKLSKLVTQVNKSKVWLYSLIFRLIYIFHTLA